MPRNAASKISNPYNQEQVKFLPLSIRESGIRLEDIIEICTPPSETVGHSKIVNTVRHVVSQLSEPFDLQRFIELVDQEKWDEDGASFMALRQTLLTTLIPVDQDLETSLSHFSKIIIDLTDPLLSTTKIDATIFHIVLRELMTAEPKERRLIVVNNAQEYLRPGSLLSKSLLSLARTGDTLNRVLLSTLDLLSFDPTFISISDYLVQGYMSAKLWNDHRQLHGIGQSPNQKVSARPGQFTITSDVSIIAPWGQSTSSTRLIKASIVMDFDQLMPLSHASPSPLLETQKISQETNRGDNSHQYNVEPKPISQQRAFSPEVTSETHFVPSTLIPSDVPPQISYLYGLDEGSNIISFGELDFSGGALPVQGHSMLSPLFISSPSMGPSAPMPSTSGTVQPKENLDGEKLLSAIMTLINRQTKSFYQDISLPPGAFVKQLTLAETYPVKFRPLARIILSLSGGWTNNPVLYSAVQKLLGTKQQVKPLGFSSSGKMIKAAWEFGIVRAAHRGGQAVYLVNPPDVYLQLSSVSPSFAQLGADSNMGSGFNDAEGSESGSEPEETNHQYDSSSIPSAKLRNFFPIVAAMHFLGATQQNPVKKAVVRKWIPTQTIQDLGFLNESQYFKKAKGFGITGGTKKALILISQWHKFARKVFGQFESLKDVNLSSLLRAIAIAA